MKLGDALIEVGRAFDEAKAHNEVTHRKKVGLLADEVLVTLVISENSSKEGGIVVNLAPPNVPASLTGSYKEGIGNKLENTIQIKLKNPDFAGSGSPYGKWDPEEIRLYLNDGKVPAKEGVNRPSVPPGSIGGRHFEK